MNEKIAEAVATDSLLKETPETDKYSSYNHDLDYVANGQIMVTITLAEYRALVKQNADKEVSEARQKTYATERERDELKKQVADLQKQLNDLRGMIASAVPVTISGNSGNDAQ
jgi:FtsZ-binding cell division protein ZapB